MGIEWNVILWSCVTFIVMLTLFLIFNYVHSVRTLKKSRTALIERLDSMKPGKEVLFSGGIKGRIIKTGDEYLTVEVAKGTEITIAKLAVSEVLTSKKTKS